MVEIFSADGWLNKSIVSINDFTWSYILVAALILCALWFTFRTHFVQFRMVGEMVRLLGESTDTHDKGGEACIFLSSLCSLYCVSCGYRKPCWCGECHSDWRSGGRLLDVGHRSPWVGDSLYRVYAGPTV